MVRGKFKEHLFVVLSSYAPRQARGTSTVISLSKAQLLSVYTERVPSYRNESKCGVGENCTRVQS